MLTAGETFNAQRTKAASAEPENTVGSRSIALPKSRSITLGNYFKRLKAACFGKTLGRKTMAEEQEFEFEIVASLPEKEIDKGAIVDALFEAGCDDAAVGLGAPGLVGVGFTRTGTDAETVITEAAQQVMAGLPEGSRLREVGPDLVSLAEVAARLGVSRQALQKREMPPVSLGGLYRASEILSTLEKRPGKLGDALGRSRSWFASATAAQMINARSSLEQNDSGVSQPSRKPKAKSWRRVTQVGAIADSATSGNQERGTAAGKTA